MVGQLPLPKKWDAGTIRFRVWGYQQTSGTGNVVLTLYARSIASGAAEPSLASQSITLAMPGTSGYFVLSSWSSALTVTSAAKEELLNIVLRRVGGDGSDTWASDFDFLALEIEFTTDAETNA